MYDNIVGFDLDWRINDLDDDGFILIRMASQVGRIEELCPSENFWHFRACDYVGRGLSEILASRYEAIKLDTIDSE